MTVRKRRLKSNKDENLDRESGPALGIGRECDDLGPMSLGGPKKNYGAGCI